MTPKDRSGVLQLVIEYGFAAAIVAGILYSVSFFEANQYLPQPFFYEPSGTWMDWYSLTQWAHHKGAYDVAGSIYPPLSFVIMKLFSFPHCYELTYSEEARGCDWAGGAFLTSVLALNVVLTFWTFLKIDRRTALPRAFALSLGLPMLFGYERGNLVIVCYTFMLLGFGPLIRSARVRWLFAGMAVNLKVYLVSAICAPLLRRRWKVFEGMLLATAIVYIVTWQILQVGSPYQIFKNLTEYSSGFAATSLNDLYFPSSYVPVISLMKGDFPIRTFLDSYQIDILSILVPIYVRAGQALVLVAAMAAWLRPEVVSQRRLVFLAISVALSATEAGGYTEIILFIFVFMERWQGVARPIAICLAYFLCIPYDFIFFHLPPMVRWSWLAGTDVIAQYGVGLTSLFRPGLSLLIAIVLAIATLRAVWMDIRTAGWKTRWRFRRDLPILPGISPPEAPRREG